MPMPPPLLCCCAAAGRPSASGCPALLALDAALGGRRLPKGAHRRGELAGRGAAAVLLPDQVPNVLLLQPSSTWQQNVNPVPLCEHPLLLGGGRGRGRRVLGLALSRLVVRRAVGVLVVVAPIGVAARGGGGRRARARRAFSSLLPRLGSRRRRAARPRRGNSAISSGGTRWAASARLQRRATPVAVAAGTGGGPLVAILVHAGIGVGVHF